MMNAIEEDTIVDISASIERSLGVSGKMLLPCPATIAALLQQMPEGTLITTEQIRRRLATQFSVDATCPFNTKLSLKTLAADPNNKVAYWRVLKKNGAMIPYFPNGVAGHAAQLEREGFAVERSGETPRVKNVKQYFDTKA
jgi:hypothetical protein